MFLAVVQGNYPISASPRNSSRVIIQLASRLEIPGIPSQPGGGIGGLLKGGDPNRQSEQLRAFAFTLKRRERSWRCCRYGCWRVNDAGAAILGVVFIARWRALEGGPISVACIWYCLLFLKWYLMSVCLCFDDVGRGVGCFLSFWCIFRVVML